MPSLQKIFLVIVFTATSIGVACEHESFLEVEIPSTLGVPSDINKLVVKIEARGEPALLSDEELELRPNIFPLTVGYHMADSVATNLVITVYGLLADAVVAGCRAEVDWVRNAHNLVAMPAVERR